MLMKVGLYSAGASPESSSTSSAAREIGEGSSEVQENFMGVLTFFFVDGLRQKMLYVDRDEVLQHLSLGYISQEVTVNPSKQREVTFVLEIILSFAPSAHVALRWCYYVC
jgi:hypothetical protein